jgi:hypothetical protein
MDMAMGFLADLDAEIGISAQGAIIGHGNKNGRNEFLPPLVKMHYENQFYGEFGSQSGIPSLFGSQGSYPPMKT